MTEVRFFNRNYHSLTSCIVSLWSLWS